MMPKTFFAGLVVAALAGALWLVATWPAAPAAADAPSPILPEMMNAATVRAIDKGLLYLANTQRADGSWLSNGSSGGYPTAMTALAGTAFLAGGNTPQTGTYSRVVHKAMLYLLRQGEASRDGLIAFNDGQTMFGHGFAMLFLAQCYGMELDTELSARVKKVLERGIELTAKSQSDLGEKLKHAGGWIYTPDGNGDEGSVTVTQLQALRGCRNVGLKVPSDTIRRAVDYLRYCQEPDGGIAYSARSRGQSRPPISAAAIACFYAAGVYDRAAGATETPEAAMVERLVAYVRKNMPVDGQEGHYFYGHYYMAQAMYQRGGEDWSGYYPRIRAKLLSMQNADGAWMGDGVGSTYGTALACTILQLPYNYLPIAQK